MCWQGCWLFLEALTEILSYASFLVSDGHWQTSAFLGLWMHCSSLCLCLHIPIYSVSCVSQISLYFFLTRILATGCRFQLDNPVWSHLEILNWIMSSKTPHFQIRTHLQVLDECIFWWGHHSTRSVGLMIMAKGRHAGVKTEYAMPLKASTLSRRTITSGTSHHLKPITGQVLLQGARKRHLAKNRSV